jgi:hypothetical protein
MKLHGQVFDHGVILDVDFLKHGSCPSSVVSFQFAVPYVTQTDSLCKIAKVWGGVPDAT